MTEQSIDARRWPAPVDKLMEWMPARLSGAAVVPVVRLSGLIGAVTPLRPGMSLAGVARVLERAFSVRNAKAVALLINSPGGSPVQSRQIYLRIRQLATEKKLPVLVFVEDVAASGGYMIACAGDEIYCDPSSILGSIGVVGGSFGLQELIKKIGVERRLYTAGEHKAMLDPFLPENPDDVARVKALHHEILADACLGYDQIVDIEVVIVFCIRDRGLQDLLHRKRDTLAREGKLVERRFRLLAADRLRHEVELTRARAQHASHRSCLRVAQIARACLLAHLYALFAFLSAEWP